MDDAQLEKTALGLPLAHEGEPMLLKHFEDLLCEMVDAGGEEWWAKHDLLCLAYARWARPRDRNRDLMPTICDVLDKKDCEK